MSATILLVEDEKSIAENVIHALENDGFEVRHVSAGGDARKLAASEAIDLAIVDVGLPDVSGFEVGRLLIAELNLPVIFLTARGDEIDRVSGLELGADDYMVKPVSLRELCARVRSVLRRTRAPAPSNPAGSRTSPRKLANGFSLDDRKHTIIFLDITLELSKTEYSLLKYLIENPGRVFSREQLLLSAWEEPEMSLERTVDSHIKSLRRKLAEIDPKQELIQTHRGFGYSMRE